MAAIFPCVVLTSSQETSDVNLAYEDGANSCLLKRNQRPTFTES